MDAAGTIASLSDFVAQLSSGGFAADEPPVWFRGCRSTAHSLVPSVFRPPREGHNEVVLLKRYMQDAHFLLPEAPLDNWDWLFSAQHHGIPTRLLDWSENPLSGLYFGCQPAAADPSDVESDGALWVLNASALNSIALGGTRVDLPLFGLDNVLDQHSPFNQSGTAMHLKPIAVLARRSFLRIAAQWGTFTIHTNAVAIDDERFADTVVRKFSIPADAKANILQDLAVIGVEARTVYPDLHHLGAYVKEKF